MAGGLEPHGPLTYNIIASAHAPVHAPVFKKRIKPGFIRVRTRDFTTFLSIIQLILTFSCYK